MQLMGPQALSAYAGSISQIRSPSLLHEVVLIGAPRRCSERSRDMGLLPGGPFRRLKEDNFHVRRIVCSADDIEGRSLSEKELSEWDRRGVLSLKHILQFLAHMICQP